MTNFIKLLFLPIVLSVLISTDLVGQSTANYAFSSTATGSLEDMSTGTTQLVGPGLDAIASAVTTIGFDFYFMGNRFTQFSVQEDGILQLGATTVSTNAYIITGGTATAPRLAAFCTDFRTGTTTGKIHFKVTGSAPNRKLVVEFKDMQVFYTSTAAAGTSTWQMKLSETDGIVEYTYGAMSATSVSGSISANDRTPSIGFYIGPATNSFASVNYSTTTASVTTPYAANPTVTVVGTIPNLNSAADGSRRVYTFAPPTAPAAPTWLAATAVNASSMTLNWTDNASNETGYAILRSTDNVTFTQQGTTLAANTQILAVTGLVPSTTYYWKIIAVREGTAAEATGTQATTGASTYTWNGTNTSWINASSWTPSRAADPTDILIFDGTVTGTATPSIDLAATQTIAKISFINNVNATFVSTASRTITIAGDGNAATDDLLIEAGATLTLGGAVTANAITLGYSGTGNKSNISGTFNIGIVGTSATNSWTTSTSSTNISTVTGTVNFFVGCTLSGSTASLIFSGNSFYNHNFPASASTGSLPLATFQGNNTVQLLAPSASWTGTSFSLGSKILVNLTINTANQTAACGLSAASMVVSGLFKVTSTGSGSMRLSGTTGTVTVATLQVDGGNLIFQSSTSITTVVCTDFAQTGGIVDLSVSSTGNGILRIANTMNRTGGTFTRSVAVTAASISGSSNGSYIEFNGTTAQTPTIGTLTGMVGIGINNSAGITATTTINDGANVWVTKGVNLGTFTYTNTPLKNGIIYNGTTAQVAGTELPATIGRFTINNPAGITLNENLTLDDISSTSVALSLTSGVVTMAANKGIIVGVSGATNAIVSQTATSSFVNIAAASSGMDIYTNSTSISRIFYVGVGTAATDARRVTLTGVNQNGTVKVQIIAGNNGMASGTGILSLSDARRYFLSSTGTFNSFSSISLSYGTDDNLAAYTVANLRIGQSTTLAGTYNNLGPVTGTTSPLINTSGTYTTLGYFALGANEAPIPLFTAAIDNNWGNAGNWNPAGIPTCSTAVLIGSGKTCVVDISTAVAKSITNNGTLTINNAANVLTIADCAANTNNVTFTNNGTLNIVDGTLNINGKLAIIAASTFTQSGGNINIDGNGSVLSISTTLLDLQASTAAYNLSGGTITIVDPAATTAQNAFSYTGSGRVVCTGTHTVRFGDGVSTQAGTTDGFILSNPSINFSFQNLIINGTALGANRFVRQALNNNSVQGTMTITPNSEYRQNTYSTYIGGNLVNDGKMVCDGTVSDGLRFESYTGSATPVTVAQTVTGSGLFVNATGTVTANATQVYVNNTNAAGVTFTNNFQISGTLTQTAGIINMGANTLTIGVSATTIGLWTYTAGRVVGKVKKWFGTAVGTGAWTFLVGTVALNRNASVTFSATPITTGGTLTVNFASGLPSGTNLTPANPQTINGQVINGVSPTGTWQIEAGDGLNFTGKTYTASFDATGFTKQDGTTAITTLTDIRLIKRSAAATDWTDASATSTTAAPSALGTISIAAQSTFSIFAVAGVNAVLPITLKSFTAVENGAVNVINWETAVESNVRNFVVEKSNDGKNWINVGEMLPNTSKRYRMNDNTPFSTTYYRLKNIDNDGREDVSNVVVVNRKTGKFTITSVSPNPTTSDINLKLETVENAKITINVQDIFGRVVLTQQLDADKGFNNVTVNTSEIPAGSYFLNVNDGASILTHRIVKN